VSVVVWSVYVAFCLVCLVVVRRSTSGVDCPRWTVSALGPIQTDTQPSEIDSSVV